MKTADNPHLDDIELKRQMFIPACLEPAQKPINQRYWPPWVLPRDRQEEQNEVLVPDLPRPPIMMANEPATHRDRQPQASSDRDTPAF